MDDAGETGAAPLTLVRPLGWTLIAASLTAAGLVAVLVGRQVGFRAGRTPPPLAHEHLLALGRVYPGWTRAELEQLQSETWLRPYAYEPFTGFMERPFRGRYVNVDEAGFRLSREQCGWPPDPARRSIFLFGGSTLFGYGVPDADTIVSHATEALREPDGSAPCLYNFGRGWYYSTQERVLFERLLVSGLRPHLAVFVDGLNEFFYANDEPRFTDQLRTFVREANAHLEPGAIPGARARPLPGAGADPPAAPAVDPGAQAEDIVERYLLHQRLIRAVAGAFDVRTAFVWQAVSVYGFDLARHPFRPGVEAASWAPSVRAGYEAMAARRAEGPPVDLVWCADVQEEEGGPLYLDAVHYSPEMCQRMGRCIAAALR